jgi:ketosteroid isomerase-like protein
MSGAETAGIITLREQSRIDALIAADWDRLAALLTEDLVHIHANGQIEGKNAYIESVRSKLEFISIDRDREPLTIRTYGSCVVATGKMTQSVRVKGPGTIIELKAATTQVWVHEGNEWKQASFQATRIG